MQTIKKKPKEYNILDSFIWCSPLVNKNNNKPFTQYTKYLEKTNESLSSYVSVFSDVSKGVSNIGGPISLSTPFFLDSLSLAIFN